MLPPLSRTALIVIDMQNGFCAKGGSGEQAGFDITQCRAAIAPCLSLIEAARAHALPIIYTRLVWREDYRDGGIVTEAVLPGVVEARMCAANTWDAELIEEIRPRDEEFVIDKNRYSAFYGTALNSILTTHDIRHLVVCGVTTNICVETTVRDASQRDFRTFVPSDACGEIAPERHDWALATMGTRFGWVVDSTEIIDQWQADSGGHQKRAQS
ncbi:MAG: isochorismatase family cysteine hydrolase [Pseudomonadota bacterium]